ncbi:MAG: hypothetical protein JWQ87_3550 [Candidatus Sulfotelmatobacter sp.]|nr:hypothetical protein [Candidatus Sulfotelmatobacter sp.]
MNNNVHAAETFVNRIGHDCAAFVSWGLNGEPRPEFQTLEAPITMKINLALKINLAFMNDLDIVAVRIEHPCRVIARIVFGPPLR